MPQRLALQLLPLSLRWIASCILDPVVQHEFSPAATEIEISHVVYQKHVVLPRGHADEWAPGIAQPVKKSDAQFFHIV